MTALVTISIGADQTVGWILATAAIGGALILVVRWGRNVSRVIHALLVIVSRELSTEANAAEPLKATVQRELTNNHGTSMKDDLDGLTYGFGLLARQVDGLEERFDEHIQERSNTP